MWVLSMHIYICFRGEGVSVFELQYVSVSVSQSLLTPHTVSSLTVLPEAGPNERISIWQEWILDCALTDGWIRRGKASLQQDLHCRVRKCLRRGCSGEKWVRESWRAKYGCFDGVSSFQLQENPHDVIIWVHKSSEKYSMTLMVWYSLIRWLVHKRLSLFLYPCDHRLGTFK